MRCNEWLGDGDDFAALRLINVWMIRDVDGHPRWYFQHDELLCKMVLIVAITAIGLGASCIALSPSST